MGEEIPQEPPIGCAVCKPSMPGQISVTVDYTPLGTFSGDIPKVAEALYEGPIECNGSTMNVSVSFCAAAPETALFDSFMAGYAWVEGVGCSGFGGVTNFGYTFTVSV